MNVSSNGASLSLPPGKNFRSERKRSTLSTKAQASRLPTGPIPGTMLLHCQALPMFFLWPQYLWLMLALPLLPAVYIWLLRRRRKAAVRYSSLGVVRAATAGRNWRRHVPPALLLLACSVLLFAAARPVARVPLPWARSTIMLAMDVSLSMRVTDVKPTRLAAAQEAAKSFLRDLSKEIEVGLVTFAAAARWSSARRWTARHWRRPSTPSRCSMERRSATRSSFAFPNCFPTTASTWAK
jgi:hypothetical protein